MAPPCSSESESMRSDTRPTTRSRWPAITDGSARRATVAITPTARTSGVGQAELGVRQRALHRVLALALVERLDAGLQRVRVGDAEGAHRRRRHAGGVAH